MIRNIKRSVLAAVAVSALVMPGTAMADVKIGFLGGYTGPIESLTPPIAEGAKLAAAQVNAQGGVLKGEKIEIVTADSTCGDATAAANAADRLVNSEKVTAIVGALCSGATISSANNAAIPGGVVMISPSSTSPALSSLKDKDLVYRTAPSDAYQGGVLARLLIKKGIKNIAITYVNNDYGKGFADALSTSFKEAGGTVAASEAHEDGKADYRAEIGSLESSGSDTLVVLAYADGSGQTVLRQALESGNFKHYAGGDGMVGDKLIAAIGADKLASLIATKPGTPELPGAALFEAAAKAVKLDPKAVFAVQSYDASFLLALAMEKNGNTGREGLAKALREVATKPGEVILPGEWKKAKKLIAEGKDINYEGAAGTAEFDKAGDVPGVIVEMAVKDGKFVEVGVAN